MSTRKSLVIFILMTVLSLSLTDLGDAKGRSGGGSHSVRGYTKKDGTYVAPHRQTNPNGTQRDNYSTKGNINPYTGKSGKVEPKR